MRVALDRFDATYDEYWWITIIVDLTIALEALFGPPETSELSHRLKLRTAFLMGRTEDEADSLFQQVGAMYDIRSRVVHGGSGTDKDIRKWIRRLVGDDFLKGSELTQYPSAVASARRIVRRALVGVVRLISEPTSGVEWPLPHDFDRQMAAPHAKNKWVEAFGDPIQEDSVQQG